LSGDGGGLKAGAANENHLSRRVAQRYDLHRVASSDEFLRTQFSKTRDCNEGNSNDATPLLTIC
jgi:hypothetical protein